MSHPNLGRKHTAQARANMSAAHMGHTIPSAQRAKTSAALKGRPRPPEVLERIHTSLRSAIADGRVKPRIGWRHTPEARDRIRSGMQGNQNTSNAAVIGECVYCGDPATTKDHQIPRGRPGWDAPGNLVPACLSCNSAKRNRTPEEWAEALRREVARGVLARRRLDRILG